MSRRRVRRASVTYYKVARSAKVRGTNTNSIDVARRLKAEKGSNYSIYYVDSSGYWAKMYPQD